MLMKLALESIKPDSGSSFRILLTPHLNDIFYWHFHPEIEMVFVEAERGTRHIGDHISTYEGSDLALIGSYIPHLNFDYGVKTTVETVVVQLQQDFFEQGLQGFPELKEVRDLFDRMKTGLVFFGETKKTAGERLKKLATLSKFEQFIELISLFQYLAQSDEYEKLKVRPISDASIIKQQGRMLQVYKHVEANFKQPIDSARVAQLVNLSVPAFCRYFKKNALLTYTDFVLQYRISFAKKLLLQDYNVTEACYGAGFENLSYFNRVFKKLAGESPSGFRKRNAII